jgi:intergrase/recombinase
VLAGPLGFEPRIPGSGGLTEAPFVEWSVIRADFCVYLDSKRYSSGYKRDLLRYLDKYFVRINSPTDIMRVFAKMQTGQRHLWLGFRAVFNFLEAMGVHAEALALYRKALPKVRCGIDLNVPEEAVMIQSLCKLSKAPERYVLLYNVLVDSGLRLVEAVKVITEFKSAEQVNGFYRIALGEFRGNKQAYYAYLTEPTYQKLLAFKGEPLNPVTVSHYYRQRGYIQVKYLRKFAFDKMVELEVPESVADFIEGRVPKRIGAKHYMVLRRQADKFYGKYADYLKTLRDKVSKNMPDKKSS